MKRRKKRSQIRLIAFILLCLSGLFLWKIGSEEDGEKERQENQTDAIPKEQKFENAWIVTYHDETLYVYAEGKLQEFHAEGIEELKDVLADIEVSGNKVTKISVKTDTIRGKVLAISKEFIEIEGYGKIPMSEHFAVYKNYGNLEQLSYTNILVGYDAQEFIVGNGEVCGAVIQEPIEARNIRVLLMTDNFAGQYHETVQIYSENGFTLFYGEEKKEYPANTEITFSLESEELKNNSIQIKPLSEEDKTTILSINRSQGSPSYYGNLEIRKEAEGLILINDVSLEKYLYSVVPSEMPASYGVEALKAQAVCARSYAYRQILANKLSEFGAHVNDSTSYQVYNNQGEAAQAIQAVEETKGQIMTYQGEVIEAYYFSTSCGHTTNADIWGEGINLPYIQGKYVGEIQEEIDFAEFIKSTDYNSYDREFPWYRWNIFFSLEDIERCLSEKGLLEQTGKVNKMEVTRRGSGNIAKELSVTGEKGTAVIEKEYAIRTFLTPKNQELNRNDGEALENFSMLPSGFFILEEVREEDELKGYQIYGGGFGHGAGMSQNGVKTMVEAGMQYLDILKFFYTEIEIENIY